MLEAHVRKVKCPTIIILEVHVRKGKMSYNNNVRGSCKER